VVMADQSSSSLAEKMTEYLENPELSKLYREKSLERAKLFDDEKVLKKYYAIFDGEAAIKNVSNSEATKN